jgi:hypothetical protein
MSGLVTTSWCAIGPKWDHAVRVYRESSAQGAPVLEGVGSAIWERVRELAADGTTLVLESAE